ncbi:Choline-sulfatase [Labilithrix luteola]|uniref:Choline-sulfatase n=1 Tax=Labilithrix luteola TaxID=1391654 RepID=A0A0K1QC60_9BACT|nr:sulfatase [Labilithrix luteola]AKV03334.1 Choline-sulfatase [Labilithrix luteola]
MTRSLLPMGAALAACFAALGLAWRSGGGAEGAFVPPRASSSVTSSDGTVPKEAERRAEPGREAYEVALRLVDAAKDARVDVPNPGFVKGLLALHWRKLTPPFVALPGETSRWVTTLALRTSASEIQWSMPQGHGGKAWAPDARLWNMNEGSYEQRESLVGAAPSSFTFHVTVPPGGKLTFSEGTVNATRDATVFIVKVVDSKGASHDVYRHRLLPRDARRWTEASCDLSTFAGQNVDLELRTEPDEATPEERNEARHRQRPAAERDAGAIASADGRVHDADGGAEGPKRDELDAPGSAVVLWGNPTLLARTTPRVPYNVLWVVVDALRPDVIASFHDDAEDAAKQAAPHPPLEALLPKIPGLTPAIDELAQRGVRFTRAYSAASWTRPGTVAMLAGARSSELGLDTLGWTLTPSAVNAFYGSNPPLLPLALRKHGVTVEAFVNNYFMVGYTPVGLDMGFERISDHRYRTRDTLEITEDATRWIQKNKDTRFFLFVNYNSPHSPYEPPASALARVPPPPAGPKDDMARMYMAEGAKDDEAIGTLVKTLADTGLTDRTIVVVTSDHGETMSSAHEGVSGLDNTPIRYHHTVSNFEETTHIPIVLVAPSLLPAGKIVGDRVRNTDLAPTILELLGLEPHPHMTGTSLVSLARGQKEAAERVVVSEGRGSRAILHDRYRFVAREGAARTTQIRDRSLTINEELYDLTDDPGERHDLAATRPEVVAEMRARLEAAVKNVPMAGSETRSTSAAADAGPLRSKAVRLRFAGGETPRRISGTLVVGDAKTRATSIEVQPVDLGHDAFKRDARDERRFELAFTTVPTAAVGIDIVVEPPGVPISWDLYLDDQPWPEASFFAGPFGLVAPVLRRGVTTDEARLAIESPMVPPIDPHRDVGLFVVREGTDRKDQASEGDEGAEEMARLLREWGYAHGSGGGK